ncbi:MAG: hypothetical protein F2663_01590 [Actinobacteria bacterium]|nr:hypothetical protein [Actinomycetota bacterium]
MRERFTMNQVRVGLIALLVVGATLAAVGHRSENRFLIALSYGVFFVVAFVVLAWRRRVR